MCLTLPETLITVMGIEKLVPTWRDLEVFLQLLPRSSTGERMNPYTSTWTGVTPGDGPQQVHLVLLDNGRTAALADEVGRSALHCIRCSACLNVCPVYERTGGHAYGSVYPGPIGAILSPLLTGLHDEPENASLPYASTLCGACYDVCPVMIDIPSILVHLRNRKVETSKADHRLPTPEAVAMAAMSYVWSDSKRWALAQRLSRLGRLLGRRGRITRLPFPGSRWTASRDAPVPPTAVLPRVVGQAMTARDEVLARVRKALGAAGRRPRRAPRLPPVRHAVARLTWSSCWPTGCSTTRRRYGTATRPRSTPPSPPRWPSAARRTSSYQADLAALGHCGHRSVDSRARHLRRGADRLDGGHRRDRHDRPRRLARPGPPRHHPGARLPPLRRTGRRRSCRRCLRRSRGSTRRGRSPGSADRRRPATSSSTGSRACTGPVPSRSSSSAEIPGRAGVAGWRERLHFHAAGRRDSASGRWLDSRTISSGSKTT